MRFPAIMLQLVRVIVPLAHVPCGFPGNDALVRSTLPMFLTVKVTVVPVAYASVTSSNGWLVALLVDMKKKATTMPAATTVARNIRTVDTDDMPFLFKPFTEK
jgi:hypothetical protein